MKKIISILIATFVCVSKPAHANVKPMPLFSDHMVIQRDMPIPVWGTADPGEKVTVSFAGQSKSVVAGGDGRWMVGLGKEVANATPQAMTIAGNNTVTINDVLIGDVWLCSGQSNMEYRIAWDPDYNADDISKANDPGIRNFFVDYATDGKPDSDLQPSPYQVWEVATTKQVPDFSAVAYYFARSLREALGPTVPIGLITDAYGATPAEAWTSREGLSKDPELDAMAEKQIDNMVSYPGNLASFRTQIGQWEDKYDAKDSGNTGEGNSWAKPDFDDSSWTATKVPTDFATLGMKGGGAVWFRKSFEVPAAFVGKGFTVRTNYTSDFYTVYVNGVPVPEDQSDAPQFINEARPFYVPGDLVKPGKTTLAIRAFSHFATGSLSLRTGDIPFSIGPDSDWRYKIEFSNPGLPSGASDEFPKAPFATKQYTSSYIFNAMINPILAMRIKGAIWYQGESNTARAYQYRKLLPALIADWRSRWNESTFPFYIIQLANFMSVSPQPQDSLWAELRDSQFYTATHTPNTGLAVTIDIGDTNNIHPADKRDVGKRLALIALAKSYGRKLEYSGPMYLSSTVEGSMIRVKFNHSTTGLIAKGGEPLKQFAIAGADRKWVWADAHIDGKTVVVSSAQVPNPVAVRYAWADNPDGCNLYNGAGLPASPFRTDDWPGLSDDKH